MVSIGISETPAKERRHDIALHGYGETTARIDGIGGAAPDHDRLFDIRRRRLVDNVILHQRIQHDGGWQCRDLRPSDGITISQQTPLSKWEKLVPEIVSSLKSKGVSGGNITVKTASSLDKQSQNVQDYVVNHVTGSAKKTKTTLVVAPVANTTESDRQYGDYVSRAITWNEDSSDEDEQDYAQSAERMVAALRLAQDEGMKVVLISNSLQGTFRMPS